MVKLNFLLGKLTWLQALDFHSEQFYTKDSDIYYCHQYNYFYFLTHNLNNIQDINRRISINITHSTSIFTAHGFYVLNICQCSLITIIKTIKSIMLSYPNQSKDYFLLVSIYINQIIILTIIPFLMIYYYIIQLILLLIQL